MTDSQSNFSLKRKKFMSERSNFVMSQGSNTLDYEVEDHTVNDNMILLNVISQTKGLHLDIKEPPLEGILQSDVDTLELVLKQLNEKENKDEVVMRKIKDQIEDLRKRENPGQTVTPVFGGTESMKESEIRQMMYSANNYFVENRLANNENSFLNSKKALKLENQDVVTFYNESSFP